MRFLLSSLFLLLVGCASYPKKNGYVASKVQTTVVCNPYFSNPSIDYVYKSNIEVFDRSFGGILVIKKLGQDHHRIAFTTEMGNTLFDFSLKGDNLTINRIIKELDRKILVSVLKRDFLALTTESIQSIENFSKASKMLKKASILGKNHYYVFENDRLLQIIRAKNGKKKVVFLFSGISNNIAKKIDIQHHNFKLKISLKAI
ncbi:hypothetical protein FK220_014480 [Flavobacteriaceae bacterium TP-CH-4]|uniref:Uncharacterized protein n=1 Tax=Pelagihabitans pacificus TaxID=2696054 RepID=A0A967EEN6_9FLAO|nr:hypothetical protein [Pelagihabitans pacificus]NHF60558.1 hypothetical protein [Pelagihabitans pacificus]